MPSDAFKQYSTQVAEAVEAGASLADAAREAGISTRSVNRWIARGRSEPEGPYGSFAARVDAVRDARTLPDGPLTRDELEALIARAARRGSVAAMKLALELVDEERTGPDPLEELKARRARRLRGE